MGFFPCGFSARRLSSLLVGVLVLAGCTLSNNERARPSAAVHADLAARLAEAQAAQQAALALWDRIIFGEVVSCQEALPVPAAVMLAAPDRRAYPAAVPIQEALNNALQAVRDAADLWNIACGMEGLAVPLEMARQGRASALAAEPALESAAQSLAAWP